MSATIGHIATAPTLLIEYKGQEYSFRNFQSHISIGRSISCHVIITEELASRFHLTLERKEGRIVIIDDSTNGSWIKSANNREFFLRHQEIELPNAGQVSFGKTFHEKPEHVLSFQIQPA